MDDTLQACFDPFGQPQLPTDALKRWRFIYRIALSISAFSLARTDGAEDKGVELTPIFTDVSKGRKRWRAVWTTLRSINAFSRARDHIEDENHSELLDNLLQSPPHIVIDVPPGPECLPDLVRQKNREHLHQLGGVKGVASILGTDAEKGVQGDDQGIGRRRHEYGSNTIQKPTPKILHIVLETLRDPILIILLASATFSLGFGMKHHGLGGCSDGVSIFVAVVLVISVTARSKLWSRRQIFRLSEDRDNFSIFVLRDGQKQSISVFKAVAGDVIFLKSGDKVPADGLYVDGNSLQVDESNNTANMKLVEVNDSNPFLLSGTDVIRGHARMLVTAAGINTELGKKPSSKSYGSDQRTPLEIRLHELSKLIANIGLAVAFLVLVVLLVRYFTGNMHDCHGEPYFIAGKTRIPRVFKAVIGITATPVAIASTAIPEGMILAVMISIAYSIKGMASQHAQVRNPSAFEAIGATTVICTDGRGNLTLNCLKVSEICFGGKHIKEGRSSSIPTNVLELLLEGALLEQNNVSSESPVDSTNGEIESAIRSWGDQDTRLDAKQVRANCTIHLPETFHPETSQTAIWIKKKTDNSIHLHQKGEAEEILNMCSHYYDENGNIKDWPSNGRGNLEHIIQEMKSNGLRCIGFAHKNMSKEHGEENESLHHGEENESFHPEFKEECFNLIGLVGLTHPCGPQVRKALKDFRQAKVDIRIVTRNDLPIAKATAIECGILETNGDTTRGKVITGREFQTYTEEERREISDEIRVMARASTLDKLLMVQCLEKKGHVVAVTGDTIGDATVLREADVGLSLGIKGTQHVKENSDVIIVVDKFDSIAKVLRWGRSMYHKIQIYAQFQLTVSVASLVIDLIISSSAGEPPTIDIVAAISAGNVPYATVQVLWAKLIVGALAALAITIEEPAEELGQMPPVKRDQPFVTKAMWRNIARQALYPIIVLLTIQFKGKSTFNLDSRVKDTMIFNILVLWQLFLMLKVKKIEENIFKGIKRRKMFWGIIGLIILFQVVMVELLNKFAHTERLTWKQWMVCIGLSFLAWPTGWLIERIKFSRQKPFFGFVSR